MSAKSSFSSSSTRAALSVLFSAVISFSPLLRIPWVKAQFLGVQTWGPPKLDVLLSLQMMEPRTIHLCQKGASLEFLSCSSHLRPLRKHLSQRYIAAKRSLYSVSTGLRSPLCRRGNRRSYFPSVPFQASVCAHAMVWGMCSEGKNIGLCVVVKNQVWGGEVNTLLSPLPSAGSKLQCWKTEACYES